MAGTQSNLRPALGRTSVLLAVDYSWTALEALPRLLARAGCETTLLFARGTRIGNSRFASRKIACEPGKTAFIAALRAELKARRYDGVVLGNEYYLDLLDAVEPELLRGWFPVPPEDAARHFVFFKNAFLERCRAAGVPVPAFAAVDSVESMRAAASALGFPVVVKEPEGHAGLTTHLARSDDDLGRIAGGIARHEGLIVQRFVEGPIGSTDVLFDRGRPVCRLSSYNGDCAPTDFSPKCARKVIDSPRLAELAESVGALTGFNGLAGIDWVQDPQTGEFLVLELNPNPEGGYALTPAAERAFAAALAEMLRGGRASTVRTVAPTRNWVPIFPEWAGFFIDRADRRAPGAWLRLAHMLTRIPLADTPLAVAQVRAALSRVLLQSDRVRALWTRVRTLSSRT